MNERIWELASKSGFDVSADGKFGNYSQMYKIEKFAELIVRECIEQIYPQWIKDHSHVDPTNLADAVMRVKEHFGVSE